jgi:hypothetical protein
MRFAVGEVLYGEQAEGGLLASCYGFERSPKPVPRRSFTSTKTRVPSLRKIRSISPWRVL